jgi:hypothetical protein
VSGYRKESPCPYTATQLVALEKMIDLDVTTSPPEGDKSPVIVMETNCSGKPYTRVDMTMADITDFEAYKTKLMESCPGATDPYAHWSQVRKRAMCKKYVREGASLERAVANNKVIFSLQFRGSGVISFNGELLDYVPWDNELTRTVRPKKG